MDDKKPNAEPSSKPFFQDTQKLTFALGLSWGIAIMAVVGFVIIAAKAGGSTVAAKKTTVAATTNTNTAQNPDDAQFNPVNVATAIGLNMSKFQSCLASNKYADRVNRDLNDGNTAGVDGTPTTFVNGTPVRGAQPYDELKKTIDAALSGTKGTVNIPEIKDDDHVLGSKKAKVLIVEYSDFQCPFCKRFFPSVQQALQEYGDKVALVYRHFPLTSIHPYAQPLAEGSECAAEIGGSDKFWEFHDQVFSG